MSMQTNVTTDTRGRQFLFGGFFFAILLFLLYPVYVVFLRIYREEYAAPAVAAARPEEA